MGWDDAGRGSSSSSQGIPVVIIHDTDSEEEAVSDGIAPVDDQYSDLIEMVALP